MTSRQSLRINNPPNQLITDDTFELFSTKLDSLQNDELLIKSLMLSVDPSNRIAITAMQPGTIMSSSGLGQVIQSRSDRFSAGDIVIGSMEWSTYTISNAINYEKIPYSNTIPLSYYLGVLGNIGITAYYGLLDIGQLKHGESVFITGAAGATGSIAAQIAKNVKNCKVIGTAGSNAKCEWLKNEIGLDNALNYKNYKNDSQLFEKDLAAQFPNGIDVYFDNTGGFQTEAVWNVLNNKARVVLCGQISQYNNSYKMGKLDKINNFLFQCIIKNIRVEGFLITEFKKWDEFNKNMRKWIQNGQIQCRETVVNGIENMPNALKGLFTGKNIGKMIVKIDNVNTSIINKNSYNNANYPDFGRLLSLFNEQRKEDYFNMNSDKKSKL
eukprot:218551_1